MQIGAGLLGVGRTGPVAAAGELDGGRGEPVRRGLPGSPDQPGVHLAQSARVADKDQRRRYARGRPQDAGNLAEREFAFEDAVVEALFGSEVHAFRECSERRSRDEHTDHTHAQRPGRSAIWAA